MSEENEESEEKEEEKEEDEEEEEKEEEENEDKEDEENEDEEEEENDKKSKKNKKGKNTLDKKINKFLEQKLKEANEISINLNSNTYNNKLKENILNYFSFRRTNGTKFPIKTSLQIITDINNDMELLSSNIKKNTPLSFFKQKKYDLYSLTNENNNYYYDKEDIEIKNLINQANNIVNKRKNNLYNSYNNTNLGRNFNIYQIYFYNSTSKNKNF